MATLFKMVSKSPIPRSLKLEWQRNLLERAYSSDIAKARKAKDEEKARELIEEQRFEMDMHQEDEDKYITDMLLRQARKLRAPIPHKKDDSDKESDHWYQGHYTGRWYLTNIGISALRKEIRSEIKELHEVRSKWVVWLSALTGIIGAITGLVAVVSKLSG